MNSAGSEPQSPWVIRGRSISAAEAEFARELVHQGQHLGRSGLALALCQQWQWRCPSGRWKTRSALAVLLELERRGQLRLPARRAGQRPAKVRATAPTAVDGPMPAVLSDELEHYRPLQWVLVKSVGQHRQWNELLVRYHYLGAPGLVGACLKYLVFGQHGELLGALGWQSAVKDLGCRDRLVGWDATQRAQWLDRVVNGVRFLVLPWVRVPHLASVMLSESLQVLQRDWPRHYGTPVWLVETFIDPSRFNGASYRAANWVPLGWTRGFAKRQGRFVLHGQRKEVYVYVMAAGVRRWVHEDMQQPLLTRAFLQAQREVERKQTFARSDRMSQLEKKWTAKLPPSWELTSEDLKNVGQELHDFTNLFSQAFGRIEMRENCELYLQGLLSNTERKNIEAMALELRGPDAVRSLQRFISEYRCDEEILRQIHWKEAAASLADPQGVLIVDASEFNKKGTESVGVAHQYCGALGKTSNCQSGVFVSYASPKAHALVESQLYLPEIWFTPEYVQRRNQCHIPTDITFQTKLEIASKIIGAVIGSGLFPAQWITCDCTFGRDSTFLKSLPRDYLYLAEVPCTQKIWPKAVVGKPELEQDGCTVQELVSVPGLLSWKTQRVCEGEKGPIVAGFTRARVYISAERTVESERWLFLRNDPNQQIKYALSNAPESCLFDELIRVSGARWPIERCFQENKGELGMDHYEHRSWTGWHRHMRLTFVAQLFLVRLRLRLKKNFCPDPAAGSALVDLVLCSPPKLRRIHARDCQVLSRSELPCLRVPSQA